MTAKQRLISLALVSAFVSGIVATAVEAYPGRSYGNPKHLDNNPNKHPHKHPKK